MDIAFLLAYLALPILAIWLCRNLAWLAVYTAASVSIIGLLVGVIIDTGRSWNWVSLQWALLLALALVPVAAFFHRGRVRAPLGQQALAILAPMGLILGFIGLVTYVLQETPAIYQPVAYLIGHSTAEDNAKWLDFTSQLASGGDIAQGVHMGGPLQLALVFVATLLAVVSQVLLGGVNQVFVAANSVVFGQFFFVLLAPLALAPMALMRVSIRRTATRSDGGDIPWPIIWVSSLFLAAAMVLVTGLGHMTLQFTLLICALWAGVFISDSAIPRAWLLTSLVVAAAMTVWLPLNVLAVVIVVGWLAVLVYRALGGGVEGRSLDAVGLGLVVIVGVCLWEPVRSSLVYLLSAPAMMISPVLNAAGLSTPQGLQLSSLGSLDSLAVVGHGLQSLALAVSSSDISPLLSSNGGTEQTGLVLAGLVAASVVVAVLLTRDDPVLALGGTPSSRRVRMLPIGLLLMYAVGITVLDMWSTGEGPHYGALKLTFMASVVALSVTLPLALTRLDMGAVGMTAVRTIGIVAVIYLLTVDTLLPRAASQLRPEQWTPPIPYNNPSSYWYPAEVKRTANQPVLDNPVACVYLPAGAKVPSALTDLPDPQLVYSCTRILAGLSGADTSAQPLVDWLRREWLTNTPAWSDVYDGLVAMPPSVMAKPVILLDKGGNVIGLESAGSLLTRFPKFAGKTPEELAAMQ